MGASLLAVAKKRQWLAYSAWFIAGLAIARLSGPLLSQHPGSRNKPGAPDSRSGVHSDNGDNDSSADSPRAQRSPDSPAKPWGHLEALRIPLEDPDEFFPDRAVRMQPPRWFFENLGETQITGLFNSCDLTKEQRTELLDQGHWQAVSNGWFVLPSNALVRSLKSSARQQIYAVLAHSSTNYAQCFPFRFPLDGFASRLADSRLPPDKLGTLQSLTYTNQGSLCFADVQALPEILSPDEFNRAVASLYSVPAYRLRLRIYPGSDIDALLKYWAKGSRAAKLKPLLESLAREPRDEGTSINVAYMFPPFARLRLYTFPKSWPEPQSAREDCFWTSMNFFNEQPDIRFLDAGYVRTVLQTAYAPISGAPAFGDLVTLVNGKGDGLHMCVYIADDFVFTKNGTNQLAPWVLMKLSDMLLFFRSDEAQRTIIVRRKEA